MKKTVISLKSIICAVAIFIFTSILYVFVVINFYSDLIAELLSIFCLPYFCAILALASSSSININEKGEVSLVNSIGYDVFNNKIVRFNSFVDIKFSISQVNSIELVSIKDRENAPSYKRARDFLKIELIDGTIRYYFVSFYSKGQINDIVKAMSR